VTSDEPSAGPRAASPAAGEILAVPTSFFTLALAERRNEQALAPGKGEIMRKIQILGPGCMRCKKLSENAETAARQLGIEYEIEKISDIQQIIAFGVLATPGLVVDGVLKASGRLLTPEEIKPFLS
jgi:small redox-active disulfide protein 2